MRADAPDAVSLDAAPDGYTILHSPRDDGRRGGGLAVIFRQTCDVTPIVISQAVTSFELQACKLSVSGKQFTVLNIYRPPATDIDTFVEELPAVIDELFDVGGRLVLLGDFNCPGSSSVTVDDRLTAALSEVGMHVVNGEPTRYNVRSGVDNLLDLIVESEDDPCLHTIKTLSQTFTDHRLVVGRLRLRRPRVPVISFNYRNIKNFDAVAFGRRLTSSSLVTSPSADPDECLEVFDNDVRAALDDVAPVKCYTRRRSQLANKWLTPEATAAKRTSRRLERKFYRERSTTNHAAFLAARTAASELVTRSRTLYVANEVAASADNPRSLWRTVNRLLHPGGTLCRYGGRTDLDVVNGFSAFCREKLLCISSRVERTLASWFLPVTLDPPPSVSDVVLTDFGEVTADEVASVVRKLSNKSSPLDLLPTSLLKLCIPEVMTMIANMANASFSSGRFPARMKIGQITPLLKKPGLDEADNKNFRPITYLSTVSKLLE